MKYVHEPSIIHDYYQASTTRGLHGWDPRIKLGLLVAAVALNVVIANGWLSLSLFLTALGLAVWSRIPFRHVLFFLIAPIWATLIVFVGFSIGFGRSPVLSIGPFTIYEEGVAQGLSAAARVAADMSWMCIFFLTTPFSKVLDTLSWYRVPVVLVDTIATSYRYTFLILDEFRRMRHTARSRGGFRSYSNAVKTTAKILAQVILRAYDRAEQIHHAMVARGSRSTGAFTMSDSEASVSCPNRCDVTPVYPIERAAVVQCKDLSYAFPGSDVPAVRDIGFSVSKGDAVVVCGANGSGKTTLLKLLAGIHAPTGGEIMLGGKPLDRKSKDEAFRYVGILFDDPNAQLFCTHVREDVAYGPRNLGLEPNEVDRLVDTAMEVMQVEHLADRPIHQLSHGEMKRVGLAGLIAMRPPLILLDEPTAGLDPTSAKELVSLIQHLNTHHGYSFLIVTHSLDMAANIANRIVVLDEGRVRADGPVKEILTNVQLLEQCRLEPPILARLFAEMDHRHAWGDGVPLTIDEAAMMLSSKLASKNSRDGKIPPLC